MKYFNCIISAGSRNSSGGYGNISLHIHSEENIIELASNWANRTGSDLEAQVGITWIENEETGDFTPSREWAEGEELATAIEYLEHDGHLFEAFESGAQDAEFIERARELVNDDEVDEFVGKFIN